MMRHIYLRALLGLALSALCLNWIRGQYTHTVFPIGNFADVGSVTAFGHALGHLADSLGGNQTMLFTGDLTGNLDPAHSYNRLDTLLAILKPVANRTLIFIPGDRDWDSSGPDGWAAVNNLEDHLMSLGREDLLWPLRHGCPGPEKLTLDLTLQLIAVNTQWWNHPNEKPTPESADCEIATHEEALEELEKLINEAKFGNIMIAGHYPVISGGEYGGHFPLGKWLFPVPVFSALVTSYRQNVGTPLHIANDRYSEFREDMEDLLTEYPSLVYVSGHDRSREVIRFGETVLVQSGIPTQRGFIAASNASAFANAEPGLIALHYDTDGNAWSTLYDLTEAGYVYEDRLKLLQAPCKTPMRDVPMNQRLVPCLEDSYVLPKMASDYPAASTVVAGSQYTAGGFKKMLLGAHYRESWTTPIDVSYLNLDAYAEGLIPYLKGGGRQTKSLRLRAENGHEYVFRSIDKDPSRALSYSLRETLISLIVRDQTSTQHPYGALVASKLLDKTPILHARPEVFVMPDDAKLGPFQGVFGNMLGMIEERPSGRKEAQNTFAQADEITSSTEMFRALYKDRDNRIAGNEFLQARMFDIFVGDWGKHEDNWKWAGFDTTGGTFYRPIPRDRDHVFSRWDGFLPWLMDREWAKPSGENFDYRIKGLKSLMWQARHLDRLLANEMSREDWQEAAASVQSMISDADIDTAVATLPKEVEAIDGPEIAAKLKSRLTDLPKYADQYYRIIAKSVDVCGSNKNEHFDVARHPDGTVDVSVFRGRDHAQTEPLYHRKFFPDETREIRIYGLQGDDTFVVRGDVKKSILLRVIPGSGSNEIIDSSVVAHVARTTRIYTKSETTQLVEGPETRNVHIPYAEAYRYDRTGFAYDTYLPLLYLFASSGNGFSLGGGVMFTKQSYDKPDYSAIHRIAARISSLGNFKVGYEGQLRHVIGTWDLAYGAELDKHYRFNYFFGTGNGTTIDQDLFRSDFYTLQVSTLQLYTGLSRTFWEHSRVEGIFTLLGSGRESEEGNIFEPGQYPDVSGNDRLRIAKVHLACDIDFRDRVHLPQRGMRFSGIGLIGRALNDEDVTYSNAKATLEYFVTLKPITLGLKVGGAAHHGFTPFFDLNYLGQNTHLRGFRQNRFTGRSLAFINSDLRIHILDSPRSLIPFKIGIVVFADAGRIFEPVKEANDPGWHLGYGAGFYFVPLKERFAIQISAGFSDEESGLIRFGLGKSF